MNKVQLIFFAVLGIAPSILFPDDEGKEASESTLQEVELIPYIAVSTRTPLPLNQLSPSVTYISEAEMLQHQDRSVVDVLERQSGIVLNTTGARGAQASLFTRGTESNHTGFFLDGRRLNPGFSGQFDLEFLSIDNLSSVEVQKGPSSVNYGSSGIGGVVSLQTRSNLGEKTESVRSETELGSYDSYRGSLNASFADEDWAVSLGASAFTTENKRSKDDFETLNLNGRFEYKLTEHLVAEFVSFITESDKELPNTLTSADDIGFSETESWLISPGLRYQNGDWSGHLFYSKSKNVLARELSFSGFSFEAKSIVESDEFYSQADYSGIERLPISFGTLYRNDEANDDSVPFLNRFEQIGFWAQAQLQLTDDLKVFLSGRYDNYTDFDTSWDGSFEILYSFSQFGTALFAKLATSYAPPTTLDVAFDSDPAGTPLNPEESNSYEVGLRQLLMDEELELSVVLYRNEIDDLIEFDSVSFDTFNVGRATTEGIECSIQYSPIKVLDLGVDYTYLTALDDKSDKRLRRRPRHVFQASAWLKLTEEFDLGLRGTGYFDREDVVSGIRFDQEDYFIVDIIINYDLTKHLALFARAENLLDEEYESVFDYPALGKAGYIGARLSF